jgi:hypothetical protein
VLDSECTNHMTGERRMFIFFEKNECTSDCITFGDNSQGQVLGCSLAKLAKPESKLKLIIMQRTL